MKCYLMNINSYEYINLKSLFEYLLLILKYK